MIDKSKNDSDKFTPWRDLVIAIGFFTRLPVPFKVPFEPNSLVKSVWAFPIAGLVVGLIGAITFSLATALGLNAWLAAFLTIGATAITTGALHEDGLADFFDGLWGGFSPARRLEIMRDSSIGGYGTLALIVATGLKVSSLASLDPNFILASVVAAHSLSRGLLPIVMNHMDLAGKPGLAASVGRSEKTLSLIALFIGIAMALALLGPLAGISAVILTAALTYAMMKLAQYKLGGYNGDTLGAIQQITEIAVLICCSAYFI